jgi:hypothetical protein
MYLDPSFGGMLLQIIVAVIAGGGAVAFGMRRKIKALFKKKDAAAPAPADNAPSAEGEGEIVDMMASKGSEK